MQMRGVVIAAGVLAVAIAQGRYRVDAQAAKPAPRAAAAGSGSQSVKGLSYQQIFDFQMALTTPGNVAGGRAIFEKQCSKCHKFGSIVSNEVGPDLSTLKSRFKKKDVLEAVLWPSRAVADQYQAVVIETKDGESHTGVMAREDSSRLLLKTEQEPKGITIMKANVTDRRVTDKSLMPEGLLKDYTQQDINNLVTFLLGTPPA
jgi:putative heme-binding domain-containing protein